MDASPIARMKRLEEQSRRLEKFYVDARLSTDLLKRRLQKSAEIIAAARFGRSSDRCNADHFRHACKMFCVSERCTATRGIGGMLMRCSRT
jgi:hypothetical protein